MHNLWLSNGFWIPACASPFLWVPPVYFRGLISPQSPDNRAAATAEVERAHEESWLVLKYLWFFSVVIAWVLTAVAHFTPPQTKGLMCCCLLWFGEVRQSACFSTVHRVSKYSMGIKDSSVDIDPWYVFYFFCFYFSTISSTSVFFKMPVQPSWLALSPLCAFFYRSVSNLISFAVSFLHHVHNDRFMAASTVPLGNNKVTSRSLVPTNLQPVCLWTACGWFDANSE